MVLPGCRLDLNVGRLAATLCRAVPGTVLPGCSFNPLRARLLGGFQYKYRFLDPMVDVVPAVLVGYPVSPLPGGYHTCPRG